jgi:hypothetical protein
MMAETVTTVSLAEERMLQRRHAVPWLTERGHPPWGALLVDDLLVVALNYMNCIEMVPLGAFS